MRWQFVCDAHATACVQCSRDRAVLMLPPCQALCAVRFQMFLLGQAWARHGHAPEKVNTAKAQNLSSQWHYADGRSLLSLPGPRTPEDDPVVSLPVRHLYKRQDSRLAPPVITFAFR